MQSEIPSLISKRVKISNEEVQKRAYLNWVERGCPEGSALEDYFWAKAQLEREAIREVLKELEHRSLGEAEVDHGLLSQSRPFQEELADRGLVEEYVRRLESDDPEEREIAAGKLAFFGVGAIEGITALLRAANDDDSEVRRSARLSLLGILESVSEAVQPARMAFAILDQFCHLERRQSESEFKDALQGLICAFQDAQPSWSISALLAKSILTKDSRFETTPRGSNGFEIGERMSEGTFHRKALFALNALELDERAQVSKLLDAIVTQAECEWPAAYDAQKLSTDESTYLIRVNDTLRMILRADSSGKLEVLDLVRSDTLKAFGALQDVG